MTVLCLPQVSSVARVLAERSENVECGPNFTVRPTWYAKEHGLSDESASEPELDEAPPLSPMLAWFPDKATSDFRVMTWNVLADFLTRPQIFPYCQPASLQWNYRKSLIVSEVARTRPSVICLQELQGIGEPREGVASHSVSVPPALRLSLPSQLRTRSFARKHARPASTAKKPPKKQQQQQQQRPRILSPGVRT